MLALLGILGTMNAACAQVDDMQHKWVSTAGASTGSDSGTGIAIWHDGTVISGSTVADVANNAVRARIGFRSADGLSETTAVYTDDPNRFALFGQVSTEALAIAHPLVFGPDRAHAFATGWFEGESLFGTFAAQAPASQRHAWVTREDGQVGTDALAVFTSTIAVEGLAIAVGPSCGFGGAPASQSSSAPGSGAAAGPPPPPPPDPTIRPRECKIDKDFVAVGGYFAGLTKLDDGFVTINSTAGSEDALLVQLDPVSLNMLNSGSAPYSMLAFGSAGDDRITGVAVDEADQSVIITGYYSGADADFNPNGTAFPAGVRYVGGRDIFVAKYTPVFGTGGPTLDLEWVYFLGTSGDDEGSAVTVAPDGSIYATGWVDNGSNRKNLWIVKLDEPLNPNAPPYRLTVPVWKHTYNDYWDSVGTGIAIDGLDRVLVTGFFGRSVVEEAPVPCIDLDPSPTAVDQHCSNGGYDAFVLRLMPDGVYDWGFTAGGSQDDMADAIAIDPNATANFAYTGVMGAPASSAGYQVDFDPDPVGEAIATGAGLGDGFVSVFEPLFQGSVTTQVSLVLDNSGSIPDSEWSKVIMTLYGIINDSSSVFPDRSVALNIVSLGSSGHIGNGIPIMPWTVIDMETVSLFIDAMISGARPYGSGATYTGDSMIVAGQSMEDSGIIAGYRSIFVIVDQSDVTGLPPSDARDVILGVGGGTVQANQICGLGVVVEGSQNQATRQYFLEDIVGSVDQFDPSPFGPEEDNIGFAAETDGNAFNDPQFEAILTRLMRRMTVCPADFDRDRSVLQGELLFFQSDSMRHVPYADWNFDGIWDGHIPGGIDRLKFDECRLVPGACHIER